MPDNRTQGYLKGYYSGEINRHNIIVDFLGDGEKTFGEIKKHLEKFKIPYKTDQGLVFALNSLKDKDRIEQKEKRGPYNLKNTTVDNIRFQGQKFRILIRQNDYLFPKLTKNKKETLEEYHLRNLIHQFGIYALFVEMQTWNFIDKEKNNLVDVEKVNAWFETTSSMQINSSLFKKSIKDFHNKQQLDKIKELKKICKKNYPYEWKFFETILKQTPKDISKDKEWIKKEKLHKEWKKRIILKNRKNSLNNIKPNQCPVCYYDGSTKVKGGRMKGKLFPDGYISMGSDQGIQWYCPACGHSEVAKMMA